MLNNGETVAGYRVEEHVASGTAGQVYRVVHVDRGTEHALKYLPLANSEQRSRFLREAETLRKLAHPNVVQLTEVIQIGADPALVMEFVRGPSLEEWMVEDRQIRDIEQMFMGIVKGVAHAHMHGIIHRDLKPNNVLLAQTSSGLVPKVVDFGLSKLEDPATGLALTRTDMSIGAAAYKSPEQIVDPRVVDSRTDVFSLGCLLYEMACGRSAFGGGDPLEVMNAVRNGVYTPPGELRADLSDRFTQAIEGCLRVDPALRLGSCEALLSALGEGTAMTPISAPVRDERPTLDAPRRQGTPLSAVGVALIVAAVVVAVGLMGLSVVGG